MENNKTFTITFTKLNGEKVKVRQLCPAFATN